MLKYDIATDEQKTKLPYLDNKFGIVDIEECKIMDAKISSLRAMELLSSGKLKNMPLNANTLCFIHKTLFGDIYPWSGKYRTMNIIKGESLFFNVDYLSYGSDEFFGNLAKDKYLNQLTEMEFVELFSYYANELNFLHPFREGNGRTKKIFLTELARRAGFEINFDNISHEELRIAEIKAFGEGMPIVRNMAILKNLYNNNIVDKRKVPFKPNIKTIEQAINRVLWIYDRESTVNWMSLHENLIDGENDIQIKLSSQKGRQEICEQLLKAKGGAKPRKALKIIDELINELTTFQNEAVKSFEY